MQTTQKYEEDYVLFLEAGFIAVNQSDEAAAVQLFKTCEILRPENVMAKIGYGYLHLHKLELKQACQNFEEALAKEPHNEVAKALLGLCTSLQPKFVDRGAAILEETSHSSNPYVQQMSTTALDFVDKFVRKEEPPIKGGQMVKKASAAAKHKKTPKKKTNRKKS